MKKREKKQNKGKWVPLWSFIEMAWILLILWVINTVMIMNNIQPKGLEKVFFETIGIILLTRVTIKSVNKTGLLDKYPRIKQFAEEIV